MSNYQNQLSRVKIKANNIENYTPINNKVLLKVELSTDVMKNGFIVGDKKFNPGDHTERVFRVVSVPKSLDPKLKINNLSWYTQIEIAPGDIVLVDYLTSLNTQRYSDENGEGDYRIFDYADCYAILKKIDDKFEIKPINGYLFCEKIYNEVGWGEYKRKDLVDSEGIVVHVGNPNDGYLLDSRTDGGVDVKVGDRIAIMPLQFITDQINLEYEYHSILDKPYFLIQRHRVAGKIPD
jgi:co-chaperonin GroES (HSP10)